MVVTAYSYSNIGALLNSLLIGFAIIFNIMLMQLPYSAVGLVINGKTITDAANIGGVISCRPTNNDSTVQLINQLTSSTKDVVTMAPPAGVPVELRCGSDNSTLKTVKTNPNGEYKFFLHFLEVALLGDKNCSVFVAEPSADNCVHLGGGPPSVPAATNFDDIFKNNAGTTNVVVVRRIIPEVMVTEAHSVQHNKGVAGEVDRTILG